MSLLTKASLVMTPNAIKSNKVYSIIPSNGNGDLTFTRDTAATQINSLGNVENVLTTIPRLNYDSVGGCPSFLLEPQRTNLLLQSQTFDNPSWAKTSTIITPNTIISPDGTLNADSMEVSSVDSRVTQVLALGAGTYTATVYVRVLSQTTAGTMRLQANVDSTNVSVNFTPTTEWKRVTATYNALIGITNFSIRGLGFTGTIAIWGAQIEQGAYATSYIPTTTSATTRNADSCSKSGISDLIGQTEGVMFIESAALFNELISRAICISDGTLSNRIVMRYNNSSNNLLVLGTVNGVAFTNTITFTLTDVTQFAKIAVRYRVNDISLWVNGVKRGTDIILQAIPLNLSKFGFDSGDGSFTLFAKVKQVQLYKTYLTDTEMTQLTTL